MNRLPECLIIVDPNKEKNAVLEAKNLGITTVSLIDTNCNPDLIDLPIPGNDDGIRSIELIMSHMADAVLAGKKNIVAKNEGADGKPAAAQTKPAAAQAKPAPEAVPDKDAEAAAETEAAS